VAALGGVFEHSPWVAEAVADARPFAEIEALHAAMVAAVAAAPDRHLALLQAHPELAGKPARAGGLGAASAAEQASLGLDRLDGRETERFETANARYRARFGFPFIIAVRGQRDRRAILAALEQRLESDRASEIATALAEIGKIARFRLDALLAEPGEAAGADGRLTIHVLDTALGRPAAGIAYRLVRWDDGTPVPLAEGRTDEDGRGGDGPLLSGSALRPGRYELVFAAGAYRRAAGPLGGSAFYDEIPIRFTIDDPGAAYHVPLILAPYGYTTYRGS
jgi:2-oxo-4-hydroxy-4-carboxy-5-ureidoimidazoline decarboxylase